MKIHDLQKKPKRCEPLRLFCTFIFVFASLASHSFAANVEPQSQDLATRIRSALSPQIGLNGNTGAVVGIYDHGNVQFISLGEKKKNSGSAPDENTVFEIGSLTKTFTGLLLSIAIENHELSESTRLDSLVPEWVEQKTSDITLLDLVTHRSGLPRLPCNLHYSDPKRPYTDYTEADLLQGMKDGSGSWSQQCSLAAHPSQEISYSNWGFATLGYVISRNQGVTYPELLTNRITRPLGLNDTSYELSPSQQKRLAQGYDDQGAETPLWDRKIMMGNGAIRTTPYDLIGYAKAYLHPDTTPFPAAFLRSRQLHYASDTQKIGYSWFITSGGNVWHNGMTGGFASMMKIYLDRDLAVFYLTNTTRELKCFIEAVENVPCTP